MKMVVGLGNPGKEYHNTRHNIGFMVLDAMLPSVSWKEKNNACYYEEMVDGEKVIFVKPNTYMNNSGEAVAPFANFYRISLEDILVIHDDMDLKMGYLRLKKGGSAGGHNGIKSIISHLASQEFMHLKIGVEHSKFGDTISHVLGKFTEEEKRIIDSKMQDYIGAIKTFLRDGIDKAMNDYNHNEE